MAAEELPQDDRSALIDRILAIELDMFEQVRTEEPSLCQECPGVFRTMRGTSHSVLSTETMASYLKDLQEASAEGRNLMTEKYARMDERIPTLKLSQTIDDIVEIESRWMKELSRKYPNSFRGGEGFRRYLSCELETYSDRTLELYRRDVFAADKEGSNLAEEAYIKLFQQLGYGSIAEVEERARAEN